MRKLLANIVSISIALLMLSACSNPPKVFDESEDLRIVVAYNYDSSMGSYVCIVVENISDKTISNYHVAFMAFNDHGMPLKPDYITGKSDEAINLNLLPGEKDFCKFRGDGNDNIRATPAYIEFSDSSTWEAENLDVWETAARKNAKTMPKHEDIIKELAPQASLAESNDYLEISETGIEHTDTSSDDADFIFTLENKSDQDIASASFHVLGYTEDGYTDRGIIPGLLTRYENNAILFSGTIDLERGATGYYRQSNLIPIEFVKCKIIPNSIDFSDGSRWINPYRYEWLVVNARQPL